MLLRITTHTGDKLFSHAVTNLDPVGTAGHLVSIVVADGIADAPTALLANHMESSLAAAVAKEGSDTIHHSFFSKSDSYGRLYLQLLQCVVFQVQNISKH